jgi:transcription initiation factor TFIIIB Brf1 subunit/transcription initiation factor TFIIB
MEDTTIHIECESCGAEFSLTTDMEIEPVYCTFCGETVSLNSINSSKEWLDYENEFGESEG